MLVISLSPFHSLRKCLPITPHMMSQISTESCLLIGFPAMLHKKWKRQHFLHPTKQQLFRPTRPLLGNLRATSNPITECMMDLSDMLDPHLTAWPAFLLTSLVLVFCWRKSWVIKRTVVEGFWSFPRETVKRSGETVGSLLLEIAIMLTLWYFGYWEHAFKPPFLTTIIQRGGKIPFSWIIITTLTLRTDLYTRVQRHALLFSLPKSKNEPPFQALIDIKSNNQLLLLSLLENGTLPGAQLKREFTLC